jgi:hypothetical protein
MKLVISRAMRNRKWKKSDRVGRSRGRFFTELSGKDTPLRKIIVKNYMNLS